MEARNVSWKDKIFEPEKPRPGKPPMAAPVPAATVQAPPLYQGVPTETSALYERLRKVTDFDSTVAGATLNKYLAPLKNLPLDENMRLKTALAQAGAQEHVSPSNILNAFDCLIQALKDEESKFNAAITKTLSQIDGKKNEITSTDSQVAQLQTQIDALHIKRDQLISDVQAFQTHLARSKDEFAAAMARRNSEIVEQKAHYASILQ
jgi:outer membrane murein-binding lipoprotein Lpp